jgi:hypothetical protein
MKVTICTSVDVVVNTSIICWVLWVLACLRCVCMFISSSDSGIQWLIISDAPETAVLA